MTYFLRFTRDPQRDLQRGASLWFLSDAEYDQRVERGESPMWIDDVEMYAVRHAGLSGHALKAETIEDAVSEAMARRQWFGNSETDSWAIFEGDWADEQDTPEGNTFVATKVVYVRRASDPTRDGSL